MTSTRARFIFVMGGVLSGVGKGTAVSAIGRVLQAKGYRVVAMKIDPYLNVDAGTMNPTEHGEVFVTEDGLETDQDLGNYERFLDQPTSRLHYMTLGQVYETVIHQERNLAFGGKCVEPFFHIPLEVIKRIERLAQASRAEIVLIEVGGTVGEYQNLIFLEAARRLKLSHPGRVQFVMVSYLPIPSKIGEMKTKPTQHAVQLLNSAGIQPDMLLCRSSASLDVRRKEKLSLFCNVAEANVISAPDVDSIYDIPVNFDRERVGEKLLAGFGLPVRHRNFRAWTTFARAARRVSRTVTIGIAGKYFATGAFTLPDAYISVIEAIKHAAWSLHAKPNIRWIDAEQFEQSPASLNQLSGLDGLIVPGGFGSRGVEGKIQSIRYARENRLPYLGLCYGMQLAVVEYARSVLKYRDAHTTEVNPQTKHPVIDILPEQREKLAQRDYGGSMRLGAYPCRLKPGSIVQRAYRTRAVSERHRHRFELNNTFRPRLERAGLIVSGIYLAKDLAEIIELPAHPFFVGVQFHPEFQSRPLQPHPLFRAFLAAGLKRQSGRLPERQRSR